MIKAIIFDCFGVLISDALDALVSDLREKRPEIVEEIVATVNAAGKGTIPRQTSSETVAGLLGMSVSEYVEQIRKGEIKNQQLLDCIADMRKAYKIGLLSNISIGGLTLRFEADELSRYFDAVVASGEIGFAKPEPQAYEIIAERLGVRLGECVFIDDREDYCQGARAVGMHTIQYVSFEQMKRELSLFIGAY